jgi:outer membrane protein OmpA-like peptidoglycan-associated protein
MLVGRREVVACSILAGAIIAVASVQIVCAQEPVTADQILNALVPKMAETRGLSAQRPVVAQTTEQANFFASLRNREASSLTPEERQKLVAFTEDKPSIDVSINFDYASDRIGPSATPAVQEVGKALSSSKLAGAAFMVAGHTDGKGNDVDNQQLSERRAEAVKAYLVTHYKIPATNLIAVGYGRTRLKNVNNPLAPENRRVQLVKITPSAVASQ